MCPAAPSTLGPSRSLMQGSTLGVIKTITFPSFILSLFLLFCSPSYLLKAFIRLLNMAIALFCSKSLLIKILSTEVKSLYSSTPTLLQPLVPKGVMIQSLS